MPPIRAIDPALAELLDDAFAEAPHFAPPPEVIIWCSPATLGTGFIYKYLQPDLSIVWRHSPTDITGGMP